MLLVRVMMLLVREIMLLIRDNVACMKMMFLYEDDVAGMR